MAKQTTKTGRELERRVAEPYRAQDGARLRGAVGIAGSERRAGVGAAGADSGVGAGLRPTLPGNTGMTYNPDKHHRRSIRLKGYDYAQPGAYFVTICVRERECALGEVVNGEMVLSDAGRIVHACWDDLPNHYPHVQLGAFIIMPNHVHGIIVLLDDAIVVGAGHVVGAGLVGAGLVGAGLRPAPTTGPAVKRHGLPEIVRAFKSFSARRINEMYGAAGVPFWQRGFYEHIVRKDRELNAIRRYILDNPLKWALDRDNPENAGVIREAMTIRPG
jgi:putative transposase